MLKRKIYDKLLSWKQKSSGQTALLTEEARRDMASSVIYGNVSLKSQIFFDTTGGISI